MAGEAGTGGGGARESHEPRECTACRGTGRLVSNLGGSPSHVTCPWCRGGGVRVPGIDAQAHWRDARQDAEGSRQEPETADGPPVAPEPADGSAPEPAGQDGA